MFIQCMSMKRNRIELLAPDRSPNDPRFEWVENVFLKYLADWLALTQVRPGSFTADQRAQIFLSLQTYRGLQITIKSMITVIQFLLAEGLKCVLTERFCQDDLEEYFGFQ